MGAGRGEVQGVTRRSPEAPGHVRRRAGAALAALLSLGIAAGLLAAGPAAHAAGTSAPPAASAAAPAPPGIASVSDGTLGKVAGMAIPNVDPQSSAAEVGRLRSDGINTISLFVWWWADNQSSNSVHPCSATNQGCDQTESDSALELQMAAARQVGMKVILVPIFYCGGCEGGWRGTMQPSDVNAFFQSYRAFIDHYAQLAQANGVSTLFIGSEMTSLESQTAQWRQVISEARGYFSGQVGYEENWDVIGHAQFVSAVDLIGISAYFPLDDSPSPNLGQIVGDWTNSQASATAGRNWVGAVTHLATSTGKPILFGEVGYMSGDYAARQPFLNFQGNANWQLQSDLYQSVLESFETKSWWAGAVWWEWFLTSDAPNDDDRSPRGKTAEVLLQRWYAQGWRPTAPDQPVALAPGSHEASALAARSAATGGTPAGGHAVTGGRAPTATAGAPSTLAPGSRIAAQGAPAAAGPTGAASGGPAGRRASHTRTILLLAAIALVVVIAVASSMGAARQPPPPPRT